jgi:esterase/lipase superfamily enzyme
VEKMKISKKELAENAIKELRTHHGTDIDIELAHSEGDRILTELLIKLGFENVVKEYNLIHKWYA